MPGLPALIVGILNAFCLGFSGGFELSPQLFQEVITIMHQEVNQAHTKDFGAINNNIVSGFAPCSLPVFYCVGRMPLPMATS